MLPFHQKSLLRHRSFPADSGHPHLIGRLPAAHKLDPGHATHHASGHPLARAARRIETAATAAAARPRRSGPTHRQERTSSAETGHLCRESGVRRITRLTVGLWLRLPRRPSGRADRDVCVWPASTRKRSSSGIFDRFIQLRDRAFHAAHAEWTSSSSSAVCQEGELS